MYQESVIMENVCTSTFEDGYGYPVPWIYGSNRQSPPPPLMTTMMIKNEQSPNFQDSTTALISPSSSTVSAAPNQHQYYHPLQHHGSVPTISTPTLNGGFYSGNQNNTMCQPLIMDDYSSNVSSPDLTTGPLVMPPSPNDMFSSTSSPTIDDQWMDLYSPTTYPLHHSATSASAPPSSCFNEQRHSFDDAMFYATNVTHSGTCMNRHGDGFHYHHHLDNNNNMAGYYQVNSSVPSPTPSSSSSSSSAYQRHQSVPSLYQHHYPHIQHHRHIPSPMTVASDVRPYQCHICNRSFARKHDLQRHIRVHTGDKPYACLCCKKAFARTDALKRHLRMEEACRNSPQVQAMKITGKRRYKNL